MGPLQYMTGELRFYCCVGEIAFPQTCLKSGRKKENEDLLEITQGEKNAPF